MQNYESKFNYWYWFVKGSGGRPGYQRIINWWMFFHLAVGLIVSFLVPVCIEQAANKVLFPLSSIFIALSFAWAVNAQSLMQSEEICKLSEYHAGGFTEYIFIYQTAVLTILSTLVVWGLAGLGIFDIRWPTINNPELYFIIKTILFTMFSITLRECWQVVVGTQILLLVQREIKKHSRKN
jgi:hypothetical protein